MSEILNSFRYHASDDSFHVVGTQDVEPYLEENKRRRESNTVGQDWKHKWHLPNILVEKFYAEYTCGAFKPMNQEFWVWVDKKIMSDPDLKAFRTNGYNFRVGYSK